MNPAIASHVREVATDRIRPVIVLVDDLDRACDFYADYGYEQAEERAHHRRLTRPGSNHELWLTTVAQHPQLAARLTLTASSPLLNSIPMPAGMINTLPEPTGPDSPRLLIDLRQEILRPRGAA